MKNKLAPILVLVLLSTGCDSFGPTMIAKSKIMNTLKGPCWDDWVPAATSRATTICIPHDVHEFEMVPQPKSSTTACIINWGSDIRDGRSSIARDGTVHWYWDEQRLNPHMKDTMRRMCEAASALP